MPQTRGDTRMDKPGGRDQPTEDLVKKICATVVSQLTSKMDDVDVKLARMERNMNDKLDKLAKLDEIYAKLEGLSECITSVKNSVSSNQTAIKELDKKFNSNEQTVKSNSLRFFGLKESKEEHVPELISSFISDVLKVPCAMSDINCAFRIGNPNSNLGHPRPILVNFVQNWKRSDVYGARKVLKKSAVNISIFEDLTKKRYEALKTAKVKYGRDKVWTFNGKIYFIKDGNKSLLNVD